jgi:diadenylate cyclase
VYTDGGRFALQEPTSLLAGANQRLQSLERLRRQLDDTEDRLTRYEIDDVVVLRDAVVVIQRAGLILRLLEDLETIAVELGDEASLIRIQASDLAAGVETVAELVNYDYQARRPRKGTSVFAKLSELEPEDLYHTGTVGAALGLIPLDEEGSPRGARALARVPRLPVAVRDGLIARFGTLRKLLRASVDELSSVEGVGTVRAKQIRTYLDRLDEVQFLSDLAD